jgi:hypothetical protein
MGLLFIPFVLVGFSPFMVFHLLWVYSKLRFSHTATWSFLLSLNNCMLPVYGGCLDAGAGVFFQSAIEPIGVRVLSPMMVIRP